jgi:hypothetical protein
MHQYCRRPIEDLGFPPWRKYEFVKQCLQQVHCQVQLMMARHLAFTLEISTMYSRSTIKNAVHKCCHPLAKATAARYQSPYTQEETCVIVFITTNTPLRHYRPPIATTLHDSLHLYQYLGSQNLDMFHGTNK